MEGSYSDSQLSTPAVSLTVCHPGNIHEEVRTIQKRFTNYLGYKTTGEFVVLGETPELPLKVVTRFRGVEMEFYLSPPCIPSLEVNCT